MIFFPGKLKKARKEAVGCLQLAQRIHDYRHDILPEQDRAALGEAIGRLQALLKDRQATAEALKKARDAAEPVMRRTGGHFYPRHWIAENAEMILFAAILAIGIRTFFLQPFKIPTNSMFPSFNGMTAQVYVNEPAPAAPVRALRFLTLGAKHFAIKAPVDGELVFSTERSVVPGRKWLVLPTQKVRYTFYVGGAPVRVDLPLEFDIRLVIDALLRDNPNPQVTTLPGGPRVLRTGIQARAGGNAFAFDLLTGDQLFVDRMSYHFVRPRVGAPIVFRTDNLPDIDRDNKDKYYIKRAVAGPGDTLQIDPPGLLLNGKPATGARAFERNRTLEPPFSGYVFAGPSLHYPVPFADGRTPVTIPDGHYFAMGDNSPNSADSRMWGLVPQREIVGRAVVIYYPFSRRWGLAE